MISNHQSNFDPIIVGLACRRRMNYVARDTLFGYGPGTTVGQEKEHNPFVGEAAG